MNDNTPSASMKSQETMNENVMENDSNSRFPFYSSGSFTQAMSGEPFSAITPSMWPQDIMRHLSREQGRHDRLSTSSDSDTPGGNFEGREGNFRDPVFDAFGFKLEEALPKRDQPLKSPPPNLSTVPFVESSVHLKRWNDYLAFHDSTYSCKVCNDLLSVSNRVVPDTMGLDEGQGDSGSFSQSREGNFCQLPRSSQLSELLIKDGGIPHALRAQVWPRLCGAHKKKMNFSHSYSDILAAADKDQLATSKQIEKDLLRTLPNNTCFSTISSTGVPRLRRILRCIAWLYNDIGYCQGMGLIISNLLLLMEEEEVFWVMCCIIEDLLPSSYYSHTLLGVQADQRVLRELLRTNLPRLDELLQEHDIELSLICLHWFLTLFANVVHIRVLLRIWDLFFYEGSIVLFRITMGILKRKEEELLSQESSADIFNCLSNAATDILDIEALIEISLEASESIDNGMIEALRRRHLSYLMAEEGSLLNVDLSHGGALPDAPINKRELRQSKSFLSSLLWSGGGGGGEGGSQDDSEMHSKKYQSREKVSFKAKNIRQTEVLVDLRNAIVQVIKHFLAADPNLQLDSVPASNSSDNGCESSRSHKDISHSVSENIDEFKIRIQADYSLESHTLDMKRYVQVARNKRRRAKALMDFERRDDDELGFRKNDIITLLSTKDEHCWIGELNGFRGWFPAKIVEMLDERSKYYSPAGDDSVNENIADLIRGKLCPALRLVFEHGLKRAHLLDSSCHPWLFIEEAATREVEKDFNSVYSRLVLCKTFRLDEDGKVLTPEEILYKAVQAVNLSHDAYHAQMDVKFRSLICYGLNEQVLHLWLETLCSSQEVVKKWYHPSSYMRSPGWVQIKCELRLLSQLGFSLSRDLELPKTKLKDSERTRIKESIQEMLVRQHLFSWELN